jgi:catechol 2,3-dioxygenase-like lactoylglutathione lyase family enzyme
MPHMLHHISFSVASLQRSGAFYDAALAALGYVRVWVDRTAIGYGTAQGQDLFAIKLAPAGVAAPTAGFHLAFEAPSREAVERFHSEALAQGGTDNGAPGVRPAYGPNYFAAFVIDPDGYRIEAVINSPA